MLICLCFDFLLFQFIIHSSVCRRSIDRVRGPAAHRRRPPPLKSCNEGQVTAAISCVHAAGPLRLDPRGHRNDAKRPGPPPAGRSELWRNVAIRSIAARCYRLFAGFFCFFFLVNRLEPGTLFSCFAKNKPRQGNFGVLLLSPASSRTWARSNTEGFRARSITFLKSHDGSRDAKSETQAVTLS